MFLFVVAVLAGRNDVALCRFSAPYNGDDVIHRQFGRMKSALAVMAEPPALPVFPPLGGPELFRLAPLARGVLIGNI